MVVAQYAGKMWGILGQADELAKSAPTVATNLLFAVHKFLKDFAQVTFFVKH